MTSSAHSSRERRLAIDLAQHPDAGDGHLAIDLLGEMARLDERRLERVGAAVGKASTRGSGFLWLDLSDLSRALSRVDGTGSSGVDHLE
jgi:hypothetical protein